MEMILVKSLYNIFDLEKVILAKSSKNIS